MEINKEKFTNEFNQIYFSYKRNNFLKSTSQEIEEIMQDKAKKQLEKMEVEEFLIGEIIENRRNLFTQTEGNKNSKMKNNDVNDDFKSEYKKFYIEFPKIYSSSTNLKFTTNINNSTKKQIKSNILNELTVDKSKEMRGFRKNNQIDKCNLFF